jgi:hypothetical protein
VFAVDPALPRFSAQRLKGGLSLAEVIAEDREERLRVVPRYPRLVEAVEGERAIAALHVEETPDVFLVVHELLAGSVDFGKRLALDEWFKEAQVRGTSGEITEERRNGKIFADVLLFASDRG